MAWTAPRTWVTAEVVTAALLNTHLRDNLRFLKGLDGVVTIESGVIFDNADGDEFVRIPSLTTAERNALSPVNGDLIYNETLGRHDARQGGAWAGLTAFGSSVSAVPTNGTEQRTSGDHTGYRLDADPEAVFIEFSVPADFTSLTSAVVVIIGLASATMRLNFTSDYGAAGEVFNVHGESSADVDTSVTVSTIHDIDVSGILSSIAANDRVGIQVASDP